MDTVSIIIELVENHTNRNQISDYTTIAVSMAIGQRSKLFESNVVKFGLANALIGLYKL